MPEREEAISHLQIMHTWAEFARERAIPDFFTPEHLKSMEVWTMEAIGMLRQLEPLKPKKPGEYFRSVYSCGGCLYPLNPDFVACPSCGRRIKWDA